MAETKKVDEALEKSEDQLLEIMARIARLRRQRKLLKERGNELYRRGVAGLSMEEERDTLIVETQQAVGDAQSLGAFGVLDWDALGLAPDLPPLDLEVSLGSPGETSQVISGSQPDSG